MEETPEVLQDTGSELTETQLSMVEEIVNRYLTARSRPEKSAWDKWSIRILFALCGVMLAALTGISGDVRQLDGQAAGLRTSINDVTSAVSREMDSLSRRVEEILESQDSLFADSGVEIVHTSLQSRDGGTVIFDAYAVPKTYVEGMTAEFVLDNGTGGIAIQAGDFRRSTQAFSADSIACTLTDEIDLSITLIAPDGTRQTQLLDQFEGLYSASLPQVEVNSDLMWMDLEDSTLVLNASSHERYVYIREVTPADASLTAAVANIRVGLFKNQKLAAWAEPCEKPDSFHGFEEFDFYQLPELRLSLTPADTVQVAAVVTDIYGRVTVSQDVPYILDESGDALTWPDSSETDPDPAHWQYGG